MQVNTKNRLALFNPWNGRKHSIDARRKQSESHRKKLSEKQIIAIREGYKNGDKQDYLALVFGITQSHVSRICSEDCYKF